MFACQKATGKNKRKNEIRSDFLLKKTNNYNPELQSWEVMAFFHEKSPSELDFEHQSLWHNIILSLQAAAVEERFPILLQPAAIYRCYLFHGKPWCNECLSAPWEGAGAEVSPSACRALTTALSLTGSQWSIPEVSSTQQRTKPHCDLPE